MQLKKFYGIISSATDKSTIWRTIVKYVSDDKGRTTPKIIREKVF